MHIFSTSKAWCTLSYNYKNIGLFVDLESVFACRQVQREESTMQDDQRGVLEAEPPGTGSKGIWGRSLQILEIFTIFS